MSTNMTQNDESKQLEKIALELAEINRKIEAIKNNTDRELKDKFIADRTTIAGP